jgi:hypothetical protein
MSQRGRLSMTDLATLRRPLVQSDIPAEGQPQVQTEVQEEVPAKVPSAVLTSPPLREDDVSAAISDNVPQEVQSAVLPEVPPSVPSDIALLRKKKVIRTAQSFRLPLELDQRWDDVARHNGVSKTDLLLMGLERLLDQLPHPPNYSRKDHKWVRNDTR